jgi:lysophospholipase L1-like esterase
VTIRGRVIHTLLTKFSPGPRLQSELLKPSRADVVFVGDALSLHGEWSEWFPAASVRTLGDEALLIGDARTFVADLDEPGAIILMLGSADLLGVGGARSPGRAAVKLDALIALAITRAPASKVFVCGVPSRPALGERVAEFNAQAEGSATTHGAVFVPPPAAAGNPGDSFMVSPLRWDATVYAHFAHAISGATGIPLAAGPSASPLADVGKGFVEQMEVKRAQLFRTLPEPRGRVVMFGDSITEGSFWDGWLTGLPVANRGIGGDTVAQLTARVDSAIDSPLVVSVLAGTNDLLRGNAPKDADSIGQRFHTLIGDIRARAPKVPIIINSVMPRAAKYSDVITAINVHYRETAAEYGAEYLDLWPALATPKRTLRKELTPDGLHLNAEGYRIWTSVLKPTIERLIRDR